MMQADTVHVVCELLFRTVVPCLEIWRGTWFWRKGDRALKHLRSPIVEAIRPHTEHETAQRDIRSHHRGM